MDGSAQSFTPRLGFDARTPSNASVYSSSRRSVASINDNSTVQEAEVISRATSQAISAARSILLSGGTQASALFTATAAAQSVLIPKSIAGEKPPLVPSGKGFFGRRKNMRQAEVIASVALVTVNSALRSPRQDGIIESPLNREMIIRGHSHFSGAYSEFTDDFFPHQAADGSHYQRSAYADSSQHQRSTLGDASHHQRSTLAIDTNSLGHQASQFSSPKSPDHQSQVLNEQTYAQSVSMPAITPKQSTEDEGIDVSKSKSMNRATPQNSTKKAVDHLNFLDYFLKKQARAEEEAFPPVSPKPSIPEEMPMPRSKTDRTKADMTMGNAARDDPIYDTGPQSPARTMEQSVASASTGTESSESKTNMTPGESESADSSNTSENSEDEQTLETVTVVREVIVPAEEEEDKSYFGVDPLITSFNDVFSCGPPEQRSPWNSDRQDRDSSDTTRVIGGLTKERRDMDLSGLPLKHIDSETLLRDLRSAEAASAKKKKKSSLPTRRHQGNSPNKRQTNNSTMEHVVMRALVARPNSPPSRQAASTRPSLNLERPALSNSKNAAKLMLKHDNSMSAFTVNPTAPPTEKLMIRSEPKSKLPPTVLAPLSSSSMSGLDLKHSHDGSSSSGKLPAHGNKSRLPWIRRNKKTTQLQQE
jgi:hypothetical protein